MVDPVHFAESFRQAIIGQAFHNGAAMLGGNNDVLWLQGALPIEFAYGQDTADITVSFRKMTWLEAPPRVCANVDWLQPRNCTDCASCAEWHRYPNKELCWVRTDQWRKVIADSSDDFDRIAAVLVKHVTVLLRYHLLADRLGITEWQSDWPYYKHGSYKEK